MEARIVPVCVSTLEAGALHIIFGVCLVFVWSQAGASRLNVNATPLPHSREPSGFTPLLEVTASETTGITFIALNDSKATGHQRRVQ